MRKKIALTLLIIWIIFCVIGIWCIGGQLAAYLWNISVFIIAPIAILGITAQIFWIIMARFHKKKLGMKVVLLMLSVLLALPITVMFGVSPITYPRNAKESESILLTMPVKDAVLFGGKDYKEHAMWPSECYAYDILQNPHNVGSTILSDYGIYGADIKAPVSGTVIGMKSDEPDIEPNSEPNSEKFTSLLGNYIYIKVDNTDAYMILAHLKQNSVQVEVDSHIEEGTIIGKVGNSGTTSEPHLHIQCQRNDPRKLRFPVCAEALPIHFK